MIINIHYIYVILHILCMKITYIHVDLFNILAWNKSRTSNDISFTAYIILKIFFGK